MNWHWWLWEDCWSHQQFSWFFVLNGRWIMSLAWMGNSCKGVVLLLDYWHVQLRAVAGYGIEWESELIQAVREPSGSPFLAKVLLQKFSFYRHSLHLHFFSASIVWWRVVEGCFESIILAHHFSQASAHNFNLSCVLKTFENCQQKTFEICFSFMI